MTGRRVDRKPFVKDQRAAAAVEAAAAWSRRNPVLASVGRRSSAVRALVDRLTEEAEAGRVDMCEHVGSLAYLGVVHLYPDGGLVCRLCAITLTSLRSEWSCDGCGTAGAAAGGPTLSSSTFEVGGYLVMAMLCPDCCWGGR